MEPIIATVLFRSAFNENASNYDYYIIVAIGLHSEAFSCHQYYTDTSILHFGYYFD